jgi:hypothetical protein
MVCGFVRPGAEIGHLFCKIGGEPRVVDRCQAPQLVSIANPPQGPATD